MRLSLLRGEAPPQCQDCHRVEEHGGVSLRLKENAAFASAFERVSRTRSDGTVPDQGLLYADLRFSNLCNFRCRTCDSRTSSSWYSDAQALFRKSPDHDRILRPTRTREELWRFLDAQIPSLRKIYFAGGEPLLEEDHYVLLDKLAAAGRTDVVLSYNTNFSRLSFKGRSVLDLWKQFETVEVGASLDGVGSKGELLRKGMRWRQIERNYRELRERAPHVHFRIYATVSAMNAFHLPEAIEKWLELGMLTTRGSFEVNILSEPSFLSLGVLSSSERRRLRSLYEGYLRFSGISTAPEAQEGIREGLSLVLRSLEGPIPTGQRRKFRKFMSGVDAIRGENSARLFPELDLLPRGNPGTQSRRRD